MIVNVTCLQRVINIVAWCLFQASCSWIAPLLDTTELHKSDNAATTTLSAILDAVSASLGTVVHLVRSHGHRVEWRENKTTRCKYPIDCSFLSSSSSLRVTVTKANQTNQVIPYHVYFSTVYLIPLRLRFLMPTKQFLFSGNCNPAFGLYSFMDTSLSAACSMAYLSPMLLLFACSCEDLTGKSKQPCSSHLFILIWVST